MLPQKFPTPSLCPAPLPTHFFMLPGPNIPFNWGIGPSRDQGPVLQLMNDKAILCYMCSWSRRALGV